MLHMKSLIRRLDCVPWLMAIGLMLGWAGEAIAQVSYTVTLTLEEDLRIREEAGATTVPVTAEITATSTGGTADAEAKKAPDGNLDVVLSVFSGESGSPATNGAPDHFRLGGASVITIEAGKAKQTADITIDPLEVDGAGNDVDIILAVGGSIIGATGTVTNSSDFTIIDNDKVSTGVYLTVSQDTLKKGDGNQPVVVKAFLNGAPLDDHVVTIRLSPAPRAAGDATATPPVLPTAGRDSDFDLTANPPITIAKEAPSGRRRLTSLPRTARMSESY